MQPLNEDVPKMGYIACYLNREKPDIFGRGIEKEQLKRGLSPLASRYSHVEILGGGYNSVRVAPPTTQILDDFPKFYKGRYVCIRKFRNSQAYDERLRYKIAFWSATKCNLGYDWFGIAHFLLGKLCTGSKNKMFCSENTLWAFRKEIPFALKNVDKPGDCMPGHFIDSDEFETVWEGTL
jgi:hypothetical protein